MPFMGIPTFLRAKILEAKKGGDRSYKGSDTILPSTSMNSLTKRPRNRSKPPLKRFGKH